MTRSLVSVIVQHLRVPLLVCGKSVAQRPRTNDSNVGSANRSSSRSEILSSKSLFVALVLLLGVVCFTQTLTAQTANECPVPPDTDPVDDPEVTAQEVDADDTKLKDFTQLVRDRFKSYSSTVTSMTQIAYFGCILREEGSPWRSDSVYPILLTPFGRVVFHTKDMTLSGRLLDPAILATIYTELGVSRRDIANLRSTDPATVAQARRAILETLAEERDAAFDATTPIPGVRPGIPGASGHAAVYVGRAFRIPLLVIAGFDLSYSHVVEEDIDYGDPTITAADVVDRETLKQFVIEAGNFFVEAQENSGDALLGSQVKVAMRDPNGPWRHGSVYIYVLDLRSNIIFIHGANPNRYEFRPLIPVTRDAVTGELILPQVIEAAKSSPEGGYVRYYFDDPTDDTDSADTPKVGYAREFIGSIRRADGGVIPTNYIVGSGFYLTAPAVVALRQNKVVETVLPQVMRSMTASTVDAISQRIQAAMSGSHTNQSSGFQFGSGKGLSRALSASRNGSLNTGWLFENSSFAFPLNATVGGSKLMSNLSLWGNFDYRKISDDNMQVMSYDGNVTSFNIGIDRPVGEDLVGGVSLTRSRGTVDYTDPELAMGEFSSSLTSINPYMGWQVADSAQLWATAGFGWGELEFEESTNSQTTDLTQTMVAAGIDLSLMSSEQLIGGGTTNFKLKGETAFTQATVEETESLVETDLSASRHRMAIEGSYARKLDSNAVITPSVEAGFRYDGGDGETGTGIEIGAALGYKAGRLSVKLNSLSLLSHSDAEDYEEWGLSGMVALHPDSNGKGLSMSLGSSWGVTHRGLSMSSFSSFESRDALDKNHVPSKPAPWLHATVRYDFNHPIGLGLWSSYHGSDSNNDRRVLQLGLQLRSVHGFNAGLKIGHEESFHRPPLQSIELRGTLRW